MPQDMQLTLDLIEEDLPSAREQAASLGLKLWRGAGKHALDMFIPHTAADGQVFMLRLRCDGYDREAPSFQFVHPLNWEETGPQYWPGIAGMQLPLNHWGEVIYCTPGVREYHQHPQHRDESHPKSTWKLARVVALAWKYLHGSGPYVGPGLRCAGT